MQISHKRTTSANKSMIILKLIALPQIGGTAFLPYKKVQHSVQIGGTAFLPYKKVQHSAQIGGTAFLPYKKSSTFRTNRRYGIPAVQIKALHSCRTKNSPFLPYK